MSIISQLIERRREAREAAQRERMSIDEQYRSLVEKAARTGGELSANDAKALDAIITKLGKSIEECEQDIALIAEAASLAKQLEALPTLRTASAQASAEAAEYQRETERIAFERKAEQARLDLVRDSAQRAVDALVGGRIAPTGSEAAARVPVDVRGQLMAMVASNPALLASFDVVIRKLATTSGFSLPAGYRVASRDPEAVAAYESGELPVVGTDHFLNLANR